MIEEQNKYEFWQEQGVAPESYQIKLFEKRVYEQAANGFFAMANIAGSYFILTVFAGMALACATWQTDRRSDDPFRRKSARAKARGSLKFAVDSRFHAVVMTVLAVAMVGALWFTKSRGALVALLFGIFLLGLLWALGRFVGANRRRAFLLGWAMVVVGGVCVAGYGLAKGGLPGGSLTYRWWYLETTAKMVADHALLGVGSGQYGRYYPRYKDIKSPEEITNPHNFLAHAAAEWGIGGLIGMVLMLVGGSKVAAGASNAEYRVRNGVGNGKWKMENGEDRSASTSRTRDWGDIAHPYLWGVVVLLSIWVLKVWISGNTDFNYVYGHLTLPMLGWLAAFAICASPEKITHSRNAARAEARGSLRSAAAVVGVGLFAFLVHNLITFSLFIPGSATTFFALLAVCIAMRNEQAMVGGAHPASAPVSEAARRRSLHGMNRPLLATPAGFVTMIALTIMYFFAIKPVAGGWQNLVQARSFAPTDSGVASQSYYFTARSDSLDPTPAREVLQLLPVWGQLGDKRILINLANNAYGWTMSFLLDRDPENTAIYRSYASACLRFYSSAPEADEYWLRYAAFYYETVLILYPSNPYDRVRMSEIHAMLHEANGDSVALGRAINELEIALDLDGQRDPEEVRRFSADKVSELKEKLEQLKKLGDEVTGE